MPAQSCGFRAFRPVVCVFLVIAVFPVLLSAGENASLWTDARWKVGTALFALSSEEENTSGISEVFPRLLLNSLLDIQEHSLSLTEAEHLLRQKVEKEQMDAWRSLSSLRRQRDDLFFDSNADEQRRRNLDKQIQEAETKLRVLENRLSEPLESSFAGPVPEVLPLEFVYPPSGGNLWNVKDGRFESFRREKELDVLLAGSAVMVGTYSGFRVTAYTSEGEVVLWEGAVDSADVPMAAEEASAHARTLLLGRQWAGVDLTFIPAGTVVSVNGRKVGVGSWKTMLLVPGRVEMELNMSGYEPAFYTLTLGEAEILRREFTLTESALQYVLVQTDPPGADVRLGSLWLGRSPLFIVRPESVSPLTLEKKGFRSKTVALYPYTEELQIPLENAVLAPQDVFDSSQKKLHNSILWFTLSLAPTFILLGVSRNYAEMNIHSTTAGDQRTSYQAYKLTRGIMWGCFGANTLLLGNVLFRLSQYLKAAETLSDESP
ncbi:MAG: hypothetical protein CSA76_01705 [Spirochaetales bacterium]|nr:MAG: hypothetical protein CSA76_01705 [Spirochaetales bacterium]